MSRLATTVATGALNAWEIQAYCLGHSACVSAAAFVATSDGREVLVSGGLDGRVVAWEPETGAALAALEITGECAPAAAAAVAPPARSGVVSLAAGGRGLVAATTEGSDAVTLLRVGGGAAVEVAVAAAAPVGGVALPTRTAFVGGPAPGLLAVGGPTGTGATSRHCGFVRLVDTGDRGVEMLEQALPKGWEALDARIESEDLARTAEMTQLNRHLKRKVASTDEREGKQKKGKKGKKGTGD